MPSAPLQHAASSASASARSPTLSVVMPVYNAAATLEAALSTTLNQSWSDFELIAVDDGSTDGSADLLHSWARRDRRLQVVRAPHRGLVAALQTGVAAARSPWLGRMDADDLCAPDRFGKQMELLTTSGADLVSCRVAPPPGTVVGPGMARFMDWLNGLLRHADIERERFQESPLAHPTVIMRRTVFERCGGYQDPPWAEDYDLWLRMLHGGARMIKHPDTLVFWSDSADRATRRDGRYSQENFMRCKARHLIPALLADADTPFVIWGAGQFGKKFNQLLCAQGRRPAFFVDVDRRKIGGHVALTARPGPDDPRFPVHGVDRLPPPGEAVTLVAVGSIASDQARSEIREALGARGHVEGKHFWLVT